MEKFLTQLFQFNIEETKGEIIKFKVFEFVVIIQSLNNLWYWNAIIRTYSSMPYPSGIGIHVDLSFLLNYELALLISAVIALAFLMGFYQKGKYWYLVALIGMHLIYSARYSQGKVSHGSNLAGLALLALAAASIIFKERKDIRKAAMGLALFFVGFGYMFSAFSKLGASGANWVHGDHLISWIHQRSIDKISQRGEYELNFIQHLVINNVKLATLMLCIGLLTELSGFLYWFKKYRPIIATVTILMHLGVVYSLDIRFTSYIVIICTIAYPYEKVLDNITKTNPRLSKLVFF